MEIHEEIKKMRLEVGVTQTELGDRINYPQPVIAAIENGTRNVGLLMIKKIAGALGYEFKYYFEKIEK